VASRVDSHGLFPFPGDWLGLGALASLRDRDKLPARHGGGRTSRGRRDRRGQAASEAVALRGDW
jgi:hypothetical protein